MFEARETHVSSSTLVRWGGFAAIAAGVLIIISEILALGFIGRDADVAVLTGSYTFYAVLLAAAAVLLPLGLISLYVPQAEAGGFFGLGAFFVAFLGTTLVAGLFWVGAFIRPAIVAAMPEGPGAGEAALEFIRVGATPGFVPSVVAFALGWLLFGILSLQTQVYPRPAVMLLIIGAIIAVIPLPLSTIVLAVAIAWLGYHLSTSLGETREQSSRPSRVR